MYDAATIALASPLRRPKVARRFAIAISVLLLCAAVIILAVVGGPGPEAAHVFLTALALSSLLALGPILSLWYFDRRERESPWLYAAAFLWGGLMATALVNAQNELAFRKRRLRDRGFDPAADPFVAPWRSQIRELRQRLGNGSRAMGSRFRNYVFRIWVAERELDSVAAACLVTPSPIRNGPNPEPTCSRPDAR